MEFPHTHPAISRVEHIERHYPFHFIKQSIKMCSLSIGKKLKNGTKFCFVRNPFSWYESYWRYWKGRSWDIPGAGEGEDISKKDRNPNAVLRKYKSDDFNDFMETVILEYPGFLTQMYGWYAPPGKVEHIGKTESLVDDLILILQQIGLNVNEDKIRRYGKVNESPNEVESPKWNQDLKKEVRRLEAPVFKRFGYQE